MDSHKDGLQAIFGKQRGLLVDLAFLFFLFGVGVAMLAGSDIVLRARLEDFRAEQTQMARDMTLPPVL